MSLLFIYVVMDDVVMFFCITEVASHITPQIYIKITINLSLYLKFSVVFFLHVYHDTTCSLHINSMKKIQTLAVGIICYKLV